MAAKKLNVVDETKDEIAENELSRTLTRAVVNLGNNGKSEPDQNLKELITSLDDSLSKNHLDMKSNLMGINTEGMIQIEALNGYLQNYYGFRIQVYDQIIAHKLTKVVSIKGKGREEIIDIVKAIQAQIEQNIGVPIADSMMGKNRGMVR